MVTRDDDGGVIVDPQLLQHIQVAVDDLEALLHGAHLVVALGVSLADGLEVLIVGEGDVGTRQVDEGKGLLRITADLQGVLSQVVVEIPHVGGVLLSRGVVDDVLFKGGCADVAHHALGHGGQVAVQGQAEHIRRQPHVAVNGVALVA